MDVAAGGTQPQNSKNEAFSKLEQPNTRGYLCMLIGIFDFYIQFLPLYDMDVIPWIYISSKQPQPGKSSEKEEMGLMYKIWTPEDQMLLERLKEDTVS